MITLSADMLMGWITGLLWPLTRVLGVIAAAPIFSNDAIPVRVRISLGIMITLIIIPTLPSMPAVDIISMQSVYILMQQILIGVAIGFTMRLTFAAVEVAGTLCGMTMGLGFASFYDPQSNGQTTAITQFMVMIAMLLFLSLDMHLMLIQTLTDSFARIPIATESSHKPIYWAVATWGSHIFSAGLHLALPLVAVLLLTNLALGILSRAAPQLNLFGIGFPITIAIGLLMLGLMTSQLTTPMERLFEAGLEASGLKMDGS